MLHPFRRKVQQLEPAQLEVKYHSVTFRLGETGVKRRRRDVPCPQAVHLILHERNERRNHQGQARQDRRRQLVTERLSLAGRHDRHRVAAGQYRINHLSLAGSEG